MKFLRAYKQKNGDENMNDLLIEMEEQAGPMREKLRGKPKEAPPKQEDLLRSNAFLYKLSEEQQREAYDMFERLDDDCTGKVPRSKIVELCDGAEEGDEERPSIEEMLQNLSWDDNKDVNRGEWLKFLRRTKQFAGDEGVEQILGQVDDGLYEQQEEGSKPKSGTAYRVQSNVSKFKSRVEKGREKRRYAVWKPDAGAMDYSPATEIRQSGKTTLPMTLSYPKSHPSPPERKQRTQTMFNCRKIDVFVFPNDGKHEGAGVSCRVEGGFPALCQMAKAVLQQPVRRLFALSPIYDADGQQIGNNGVEITPGAGTTKIKITPGMEIAASAGQDFVVNDPRSVQILDDLGLANIPAEHDDDLERTADYNLDGHLVQLNE